MFTREQIEEIAKALQSTGAKDSSFPVADKVTGNEDIIILKDRLNYRAKFSSFYEYLSDNLIKELEDAIAQDFQKILDSIAEVAPEVEEYLERYFTQTIMPQIQTGFENIISEVQSSQSELEGKIDSIQSYLESTIDSKIQEVLDSLQFEEVLTAIANLNDSIISAINSLKTALTDLINSSTATLSNRITEVGDSVEKARTDILNAITAVSNKIDAAKTEILAKIDNIYNQLKAQIDNSTSSINSNVDTTREQIIDNNLLARLNRVEETLAKDISDAQTSIESTVTSAQQSLGDAIAEVQNILTELITSSSTSIEEDIAHSQAELENKIQFTQDWLEQWWNTTVTLKVTCPMENAEILLNGNDIPQITVPIGSNVNVQVSAEGYYRFNEVVNVWRDTTIDVILENRNPLNEAIIEVHPTPQNATVYLDNEEKWRTVVVPGSVVNVRVEAEDYVSYNKDITVNSDTVLNIVLNPVQVPFTVNASPEGCTIKINGVEAPTGTAQVDKNSTVTWEVSKEGYVTQSGQTLADQDTNSIDVTLQLKQVTIIIAPVPSDSSVIINEVARNSITVAYGTEISYTVSHTGYVSQTGTHTATEDTTIDVVLVRNYVILPDAQLYFAAAGETKNVSVQSNTNWIFR